VNDPTTTTPGWSALAAELARKVADAVDLGDLTWLDAVRRTPRHVFVPRFYRQDGRGDWDTIGPGDPSWLDSVYQDMPLVTALLTDERGHKIVVSSSTKPALMLRMLHALDIEPHHRVLEIGTGTGYNAALLCRHNGDDAVFSIDIGADLVSTARTRLAELGHTPTLRVGDGMRGMPGGAPYDRIIATCSVPAIPSDWTEQLVDGGLLLVDLKVGLHAGNLVLLRRHPDRLEGRFLPKWAAFMSARDRDAVTPTRAPSVSQSDAITQSMTRIDPDPWSGLVPWFLAQAGEIALSGYGLRGPNLDTRRFSSLDGSWCQVGPPDADGNRQVSEGGPRRLWLKVEHAHREWNEHGQPGWDRIGLTITPDGTHRVWLDTPNGTLRRSLQPATGPT
jgi:protein-L-isoaspartate(D-aspartate) O-methyltransferase